MFKSLTNIVKGVAEVTVKPVVQSVEMSTAMMSSGIKPMNDATQEIIEEIRGDRR